MSRSLRSILQKSVQLLHSHIFLETQKRLMRSRLWSRSRSIRLLLDPVRMDVWKTCERQQQFSKVIKYTEDVRVMVIPATQKIYKQCIHEGLLDIFVDAGCAVNTPSCGPCMGGHMGVMAAGEKCVSTTNRNFVGRMGHVDSLIYLASPEVAAASAIAGCIANPEKVEVDK